MTVAMERPARMVEAFAAGESIDEIAQRTGLERATVEMLIRHALLSAAKQALRIADVEVTQ